MGKIHVLPENLVNQIAAGEVVERPASVVKELVENALDAGASSVRVELAEGGLKRILVSDDGSGMSPDDARACLGRHATSKLTGADGLHRIATMGFRGEAVPAIASVSRFTLTTRERTAQAATRVVVEGGRVEAVEEVGAPVGTAVIVDDLFFNTPARRKFVKRSQTEAAHASEAVVRLALARPEVGFALVSGGRLAFQSAAASKDPRERVAAALGTEVFKHLIALDVRTGPVAVSGWVASPDFSLSTSRGIYTYVNRRFVRDRGLMAAVQRAFADVSMPGRHPAAVLFLDVPLEEVDVNVHPQKLEVRFADARRVFDGVFGAIQHVLRRSPWLPGASPPSSAGGRAAEIAAGYISPPPENRRFAFHAVPGTAEAGPEGSAREGLEAPAAPDLPPPGYFHALRVIGQFAKTYLVCEAPGGKLVVVDQHAAHERLKFDRLRRAWRERRAKGQAFLFPARVELPVGEARTLAGHLDEVLALGFEVEPFGGASFAVKAVPAPLVGCDLRQLLTDLASELLEVERGRAVEEAMEEVLATMACHAAVRANQALSPEEGRALLDSLDDIDFATRCPHGRPIAAQLSLEDLERRVARR